MSDERYARHALIDWFSQAHVAAARVAVIGAGAVGNEVIKNLALLGAGSIDVFDFDRIEAHNLTRSVLFRDGDIGRSKVQVAVERAAALDPNVRLKAYEGDFWDTLSLHALREYSCVIACVDNFEARVRLNQMCLIAGVDLINTGLDSRYASVEIFPFSGTAAACYECHLPASAYQRIAERYSCGWLRKRAFEARRIPTTVITASAAGAIGASFALRLGQDAGSRIARRVLLDTIGGTSTAVELHRASGCVGCASLAARPQLIRARRGLAATLDLPRPASVELQLSDPVITNYRCAHCGDLAEAERFLMQPASRYDDRIARCPRCRQRSVQIEIRDTFTLDELEQRHANDALPAKFVLARLAHTQLCIELED